MGFRAAWSYVDLSATALKYKICLNLTTGTSLALAHPAHGV